LLAFFFFKDGILPKCAEEAKKTFHQNHCFALGWIGLKFFVRPLACRKLRLLCFGLGYLLSPRNFTLQEAGFSNL
jgi:hypothetical protein